MLRTGLILVAASVAAQAEAAETITYVYDVHGRLVQVNHSGTVNNGVQATYQHDPADNRTQVVVVKPTP